MDKLTRAELDYRILKCDYEVKRANIWFNTDWQMVTGKPKPTEKDKQYHIDRLLSTLKVKVQEARVRYHGLLRERELELTLLINKGAK